MTTGAPHSAGIFTIGHSAHEVAQFTDLLARHRIGAVADVRSVPYSRRHPQFNREELKGSLKACGIAYVYLGKELGARSNDPACHENGRVQFQKVAKATLFQSGIERILDGSQRMNIALMCAEKDPLDCHRTILIARELVGLGKDVNHILANGELETHHAAIDRLCKQLGIEEDLLRPPEELENDAYSAQEDRIAYASKEHEHESRGAQE